ncbi:methyltransferase domain-containing protein [Arthrobacter sp. NPDC056727]|uniref:methyltransferase domain-containing protein n=1 Tax=Arthrobacter sp. NPDC056727 TaxID=3345927 RepID=UPI00366B6AB0
MLPALKKYLLLPKLVKLSSHAPKDPSAAWDQYWGKIRATGARGDVLWDSGSDHELQAYLEHLTRQLDPSLPLVDVGCGSGVFSRALAPYFPHVLGVDVSANAIARAAAEPDGMERVSYVSADMTAPAGARAVADALAAAGFTGEANIFIRGVLHVLKRPAQAALAAQLHPIAGRRGRLFLAETDFRGNPVQYVSHLGATVQSIPGPLERAIRALPMPGRFGAEQRRRAFPEASWDVVEDGPVTIETRPLTSADRPEQIPGYFAVLQAR